jgi:hypothetical protein
MRRIGPLTFSNLLHHMLDGALSMQELAEVSGLHVKTVNDYCRAMHAKRAIHICGWAPDATGRFSMPLYKLGAGRDVKNKPYTPAERAERYRERKSLLNAQIKLTNAIFAGSPGAAS